MTAALATLLPAMHNPELPVWPSATWIGTLDLPTEFGDSVSLMGSAGYRHARLLVRKGARPVAFIHADVEDGCLDGAQLRELVAAWNDFDDIDSEDPVAAEPGDLPSISVVICTRDRPEMLKNALASVLRCDYPDFDVVVVDNAASDDHTLDYVRALDDPRVRVVTEATPGLAVARNTGVLAARGQLIAFTDDDVVVEPLWLRWFGAAAAASDQLGCVTGLVPSGELRTPTQRYFEKQVHWSNNLQRNVFDLADPPADAPLFPFQVGLYGTGASFAMPRAVVFDIGGFDEGLGVGSPTGGGEDIDMFVRVVASGRQLVYEPAAIVWHRHRADVAALTVQTRGYGLGLGAWLTKVACDRTLLHIALRRSLRAVGHLHGVTTPPEVEDFLVPSNLRRAHALALLRGPIAYLTSRRQGRRARPLASVNSEGRQSVRVRKQAEWLALLAVVAGVAGAFSTLLLGGTLTALSLLVLMLGGAGSAIMCWLDVEPMTAVAGVIGLSVVAVIVVATGMAWLSWWYPIPSCLVMSAAVAVSGFLRLRQAPRSTNRSTVG